MTELAPSAVHFTYAISRSLSTSRKRRLVNCWSAGFSRRAMLTCVTKLLMLPGASQSRTLIWYFSEWRYSSRPAMAAFSHSSKPL